MENLRRVFEWPAFALVCCVLMVAHMEVSDAELKYVARALCHSEGLDPDEEIMAGDPENNHAMLESMERWQLYKREARRAIVAFSAIEKFREMYP